MSRKITTLVVKRITPLVRKAYEQCGKSESMQGVRTMCDEVESVQDDGRADSRGRLSLRCVRTRCDEVEVLQIVLI